MLCRGPAALPRCRVTGPMSPRAQRGPASRREATAGPEEMALGKGAGRRQPAVGRAWLLACEEGRRLSRHPGLGTRKPGREDIARNPDEDMAGREERRDHALGDDSDEHRARDTPRTGPPPPIRVPPWPGLAAVPKLEPAHCTRPGPAPRRQGARLAASRRLCDSDAPGVRCLGVRSGRGPGE